jgi:MHS family citrate/tricarballylate:H+ symporter-like MFS transporter
MTQSCDDSKSRVPFRHVLAVFVGNGLEFYDFLTFSYFAVYISRTFYPGDDPTAALLATLATFGAGFLTRPIGAIVIGRMGDRIGRKPAMLVSFALMGIAILGIALLPSYSAIGVAAPVLLLLLRLLQGFALGGEVGPTTAYMAEAAPRRRRGLYLSMQYVTQDSATLMAGLVGTVLAALLDAQQLQDWGWRVAMLLGASILPIGLMLRRTLPETLNEADSIAPAVDVADARSFRERFGPYLAISVLGLIMLMASTIGFYTTANMTTFALTTLELAATISFGVTILNGTVFVICDAMSGWLSDRFGRKPVMLIPGAILVVAIVPCFWIIEHYRSAWALYSAQTIMVMLLALSGTPVIVTITLPQSVRSGAVAMIYAFAISVFGGSTQFVITWLVDVTESFFAPAYYWTAAAVLGLVAMMLVKETAPTRLERASSSVPAQESS